MAYMRQRGVGDYDGVSNYEWMFNPPPYNFLDAKGVKPPPNFYAPAATMGLGCGSSCSCAGTCAGRQKLGLGLFDSADWTTWGLGEWLTLGVGLYLGVKLLGDIGGAARGVRKAVRKRRGKSRRKKELQEELASI